MAIRGLTLYYDDSPKISEKVEVIYASLERLIFQSVNEVPGLLDVGSKLQDLFWEPATRKTADRMIEEIKFLVSAYESRITLKEVAVNIINLDSNDRGIHIKIDFIINGEFGEQSVDFNRIVEL